MICLFYFCLFDIFISFSAPLTKINGDCLPFFLSLSSFISIGGDRSRERPLPGHSPSAYHFKLPSVLVQQYLFRTRSIVFFRHRCSSAKRERTALSCSLSLVFQQYHYCHPSLISSLTSDVLYRDLIVLLYPNGDQNLLMTVARLDRTFGQVKNVPTN